MGEVFFRLGQTGAEARLTQYNSRVGVHYKTLHNTHSYDKYYICKARARLDVRMPSRDETPLFERGLLHECVEALSPTAHTSGYTH